MRLSPAALIHPAGSEAPAPLGRIGEEVRDGKFAFTVTKTATSPVAGGHTAQGTYLIVAMTVRNTSTEPWSFFANAQKLKDFGGRFEASLGTFSGDFQDGDDINPGNQITAKIAFDVPPDPNLTACVRTLHDSMFSGGVKVSLGQ